MRSYLNGLAVFPTFFHLSLNLTPVARRSNLRSGGYAGTGGPRGAIHPTLKVRNGGGKEIPLVQGKRNPSKMVSVARGHQKEDTLKSYSQKTSQSNHTRTTALSNSMKPSHALWGHPRWTGHGGDV